jgi:hypothetical protein
MTWTIYNNDRAWGFLSEVERNAILWHGGCIQRYDQDAQVWQRIDKISKHTLDTYRAEIQTPAQKCQNPQLDIANARIAELEAANDDLRERYKAFACWAERKLSGIKTEEAPCSPL